MPASLRWRSTGLPPEPRKESVVESRWHTLDLSYDEQAALQSIGERLAKQTDRFGQVDPERQSSRIHFHRLDEKKARIRILDSVGIVAIPGLQLSVMPKIPVPHLVDLLRSGNLVPRLSVESGEVDEDSNLAVLIAHWLVSSAERILEEGLARDYRLNHDELNTVRGRVIPLRTARLHYGGRLSVAVEYEEFDFDTPLNRLILHATRLVANTSMFPTDLRRRAIRVSKRMDGVGAFQDSDLRAAPERRTSYYADAANLAREIIRHAGRSLDAGSARSWTFLFRTPEMVETGIRAVLKEALAPLPVRKRQVALGGTSMTVNPDLVFGSSAAVADVKYKLAGKEWDRADLYELVAFGAAVGASQLAIVTFRAATSEALDDVEVGDFRVRELAWPVGDKLVPDDSRDALIHATQLWLAGEPAAAAA